MRSSKVHKMTQLYQFVSLKRIMMGFDTIQLTCLDFLKLKDDKIHQKLGK